jgi:tRNA-specific 2-thiouridylase
LESIRGRSRKEQLRLANKFGIIDPPNAAGGCLLTDPQFAKRVRDLLKYSVSEPSINDVEMLKLGRHFRIDAFSKLIVGRNHGENEILLSLSADEDYLIQPCDIPGPTAVLRISGKPDLRKHKKVLMTSIGIVLRYSDSLPDMQNQVKVTNRLNKTNKVVAATPWITIEVDKYRI